jgi:amino acid transporter
MTTTPHLTSPAHPADDSVGSLSGYDTRFACALCWVVVINAFFAGVSSVAVTGRITYALARDNGFPLSSYMAELHTSFQSPVNALLMVCVVDSMLLLLPLAPRSGATAFTAITNLSSLGFQVSYGLPILLKLIYQPPDFAGRAKLSLGKWSNSLGLISAAWLFGTNFLLFLPTVGPVKANNMNWMCVVASGVALIAAVNWVLNSRYHFTGPRRVDGKAVYAVEVAASQKAAL